MSVLMTIDNGGTFTDACLIKGDKIVRAKTLTTPYDLTKCFIDVINRISEELYGEPNIRKLLQETEYLRYSTTAGTNAIVQKRGPRIGLIVRKGTDTSFLTDSKEKQDMFKSMVDGRIVEIDPDKVKESLEAEIVEAVNTLLAQGVNRLAISFTGETLAEDEIKVKNIILRKYPRHLLGAIPMIFSHEVAEDKNDSQRTWTALINSFLHMEMERFLYNSENFLRDHRMKNPLLIFHNDGNSARVAKTTAIKTYGSGPRGGMEGTRAIAQQYKLPALLTLDIGGTTSDIGLVKEENIKVDRYGHIEGIPTSFSLSDLISIGAGGSSVFSVKDNKLKVGPESVGAVPGPACFGRGGQEATVTDAYFLMGVLDSRSYFRGSMTLDQERAKRAVIDKVARPLGIGLENALVEMEKQYCKKIADGLATYQKQVEDVTLLAFGGAGPMSACGVAEAAGIQSIIVPRLAAVFSAFGIGFSDIAHEYQTYLSETSERVINEKIKELEEKAERDMFAEGFNISECRQISYISYFSEDEEKIVPLTTIHEAIKEVNGQADIRLHLKVEKPIVHFKFEENQSSEIKELSPIRTQQIINENIEWEDVPVYSFDEISPGTKGVGPALIEDEYFTCRVLEGWEFEVNNFKDIFLSKKGE
jgi:N-methylhydantoinase A